MRSLTHAVFIKGFTTFTPRAAGMPGTRCEAFTSSKYWFKVVASGFVRGGDLSILSDAWVVGLGTGFTTFPKILSEVGSVEDVTGGAHVFRTYNVSLSGRKVTVVVSAGGSGYAEAIVAMASERGVKALVGVGLCGALSDELSIGDVVIPTGSVREDCLTDRYVPPGYPATPDYGLLKELEESLRRYGLNPIPGTIVTTASTFTESREWAENHRRRGVLCVECEASVIFTLARLCRIPSAIALVVSDSVIKEEEAFTGGEARARMRRTLELVTRAALDASASFAELSH